MPSNPFGPPLEGDNPFRPPAVTASVRAQRMSEIEVRGKYLIVPDGTVLPPICVKTNRPVGPDEMVHKTFEWAPTWLMIAAFMIAGIVALVVYAIVRKRCQLTFGLAKSVRNNYRRRFIIKVAVALLTFAMFIVGLILNQPLPGIIGIWLFLFAIIAMLVNNRPLSVVKFKDNRFWVKGCSPEYLAQFETPVIGAAIIEP